MARRFRYINGRPLSLPVAINATAVQALLRAEYERACGGKCDSCPATTRLDLVRRDGRPRERGVYAVTEILNYAEVVGGHVVLPASFTLRCRSCHQKIARAWRQQHERQMARRAARRREVEPASPAPAASAPSPAPASSIQAPSPATANPPPAVEPADDEVRQFVVEHPAIAARIELQHGRIEEVSEEWSWKDGRPQSVIAWTVLTASGRLRVPALRAA